MVLKLDHDLLKAKIFHGLKSLTLVGDTLNPRYLEIVLCQCFGLNHTGDGNFFADGVRDNIQASVKTRKLNPEIKKRVVSKDFQSDPTKFLGYTFNKKQDLIWEGLEFIQRRQAFPNKNDLKMDAETIGKLSIKGFEENINESKIKFNTQKVYEILVVHGYDRTENNYIVSVFWQEYASPDLEKITWSRISDSVIGKQKQVVNGKMKEVIVCRRWNGNARRTATNYAEYKNPTKYKHSASIILPLPDPWKFDKDTILEEINLKDKLRDNTILFTE